MSTAYSPTLRRHEWETPDSAEHGATREFGRVAALSVALLVLSGACLAVQHTPSIAGLRENLYGEILLLKLVTVALAGWLALVALRAKIPVKPRWWRQELTVVLAVLAFAGLLVSVAPPR